MVSTRRSANKPIGRRPSTRSTAGKKRTADEEASFNGTAEMIQHEAAPKRQRMATIADKKQQDEVIQTPKRRRAAKKGTSNQLACLCIDILAVCFLWNRVVWNQSFKSE